MHIEGPWLSTTSTKQRAEKLTKAKQEELERSWRERNVRLKEMHLPKESFEQFLEWIYGRGQKTKRETSSRAKVSTPYASPRQSRPNVRPDTKVVSETKGADAQDGPKSLGSWVTGPVSSKPSPTYTGTKVLGIAIMHKSNLVPVFSDEEATDISKMRRG